MSRAKERQINEYSRLMSESKDRQRELSDVENSLRFKELTDADVARLKDARRAADDAHVAFMKIRNITSMSRKDHAAAVVCLFLGAEFPEEPETTVAPPWADDPEWEREMLHGEEFQLFSEIV